MGALEVTAWLVFVAAQAADVITTRHVLGAGGRELNPIVRALISRFGARWWIAKLVATLGAALVLQWQGLSWAVLALGLVTGGVAFNNWREGRR